jgi:hypothetical protein
MNVLKRLVFLTIVCAAQLSAAQSNQPDPLHGLKGVSVPSPNRIPLIQMSNRQAPKIAPPGASQAVVVADSTGKIIGRYTEQPGVSLAAGLSWAVTSIGGRTAALGPLWLDFDNGFIRSSAFGLIDWPLVYPTTDCSGQPYGVGMIGFQVTAYPVTDTFVRYLVIFDETNALLGAQMQSAWNAVGGCEGITMIVPYMAPIMAVVPLSSVVTPPLWIR